MLVVPAPTVGLDHPAAGGEAEIGRPAMGRHVEHLDLVGVVGEELAQAAPVVGVGLLLEPDDPGRHRQDAVGAQQADRLAVGAGGAALADELQRRLVGVLHPEEKALPAGLLVEVQDIGITHDIVGPRRADEDQVDPLGDERVEEGAPGPLRDGWVLVGEVHDPDAVLPVQPRELAGEQHGVPVAPAGPEAALAAVVAEVRAAPRELHHHRAKAAPVAVASVTDEFPADPVGVEVADHRGRCGRPGQAVPAMGDAGDGSDVGVGSERGHQAAGRLLALAAHDRRDVRFRGQDLAPVVGRVDAAIDDGHPRHPGRERRGDLGDHRMPRGRAGMPEEHGLRPPRHRLADDREGGHRPELPVDEADLVAVVDQRPADREQPQRREVVVRDAAADRRMRYVDEEDAHGRAPHAAAGRPPKRRCLARNAAMASARSSAPKSGQSRGVKCSSA